MLLLTEPDHAYKARVTLQNKEEYVQYPLYLDPRVAGICDWKTRQCSALCLFTAGHGGRFSAKAGRKRKTTILVTAPEEFHRQLMSDLRIVVKRRNGRTSSALAYKRPVVRLDGTSDLGLAGHYSRVFPEIIFMDYTKSIRRALEASRSGVHNRFVTFSLSEHPNSNRDAQRVLDSGGSVAAVCDLNKKDSIDPFFKIGNKWYPTVDGDEHDLRFLDPPGTVAVLRPKGKARRMPPAESGFVRPRHHNAEHKGIYV